MYVNPEPTGQVVECGNEIGVKLTPLHERLQKRRLLKNEFIYNFLYGLQLNRLVNYFIHSCIYR